MSDTGSGDIEANPGPAESDKRQQARRLAERALREQAAGHAANAADLLDRATRTDPEAAAEVLSEAEALAQGHPVPPAGTGPLSAGIVPDSDEELAHMSEEVRPGSAAPSRAGIVDRGSGADGS